MIKKLNPILICITIAIFVFASYIKLVTLGHLTFSDSAKFSQSARSLLQGKGLTITHSFYDPKILSNYSQGDRFQSGFLPFSSLALIPSFMLLGASDQSVFLTGGLFFVLSSILIYLIGKDLDSKATGVLATILFIFNQFFLDYGANGNSEIYFIFELLLFGYLYFIKPKLRIWSLLPIGLMLITRQQSLVFIFAFGLLKLLELYQNNKRIFIRSALLTILIAATCLFMLNQVSFLGFKPYRYIGMIGISSAANPADYLRGGGGSIAEQNILTKLFYNLYNFIKQPERIAPVAILTLFILGAALPSSGKLGQFRLFSLILFIAFLTATSITLPNARYIHPVVPFLIISASAVVFQIKKNLNQRWGWIAIISILFIAIGPVVGNIFIDSRFRRNSLNLSSAPAYMVISDIISGNIMPGKLILTNMDAWIAWYNDLTTMWFPLSPDTLQKDNNFKRIDYLALTNYKELDSSFRLGEWRGLVYEPHLINNSFLNSNFLLMKIINIPAKETLENQDLIVTIYKRKL